MDKIKTKITFLLSAVLIIVIVCLSILFHTISTAGHSNTDLPVTAGVSNGKMVEDTGLTDGPDDLVYREYPGLPVPVENTASITILSLGETEANAAVVILTNSRNGEQTEKMFFAGVSFENIPAGSYFLTAFPLGEDGKKTEETIPDSEINMEITYEFTYHDPVMPSGSKISG